MNVSLYGIICAVYLWVDYLNKSTGNDTDAKGAKTKSNVFAFIFLILIWLTQFFITFFLLKQQCNTPNYGLAAWSSFATWFVLFVPLFWCLEYLYTWLQPFGNTFGYLVGRKIGKRKIAPGVSPKKSLEGLIASILAGTTSSVLLMVFVLHHDWYWGLVTGSAVLVAAVFGDLAESLIKRDLGVKDMSSWLPGHGGIMDRMDSMLPSGLAVYFVATLCFAL
ncbi:MAG: hypothetical protein EBY26_03660 [Microbacteriaceae bacterium]|nr:hypothetical protein [Microbacteriaceae bacterium]